MLEIDVTMADASGSKPIFTLAGLAVQARMGIVWVGVSLALGMIKFACLVQETGFHAMILGKPHRARLLTELKFDAKGTRLRA